MRQKYIWTMIIAFVLISFFPHITNAQNADWSAWLFDGMNHLLTLVDNSGKTLKNLVLPIDEDSIGEIKVSSDGVLIAYSTQNWATIEHYLRVYDTDTQRLRFEYTYQNAPDTSSSIVFNDEGTALALGHSLPDGTQWEIVVFDTNTGKNIQTLSSVNPSAANLRIKLTPPLLPALQRYVDDMITVVFKPGDGIRVEWYPAFQWSMKDGTVKPVNTYISPYSDTFIPTGEVIAPTFMGDVPNFPVQSGYGVVYNVLSWYEAASQINWNFFLNPDAVNGDSVRTLWNPRFVQNGERILVTSMRVPSQAGVIIRLIERDGTVVDEWENRVGIEVGDLTDGFAYTWSLDVTDWQTNLVYVNTRESNSLDNGQIIWTSEPDHQYRLIWIHDNRDVPLGPFIPWVQYPTFEWE